MSNLSRRSLVTSAAALPALAVPVVALDSQAELLALGEQLKPLVAELHRLEPKCHRLYEQAMEAAGYDKLPTDGSRTPEQSNAAHARFDAMADQCGYFRLYEQVNAIDERARQLAQHILEIEPTDRIGDGIHAAAALVLDEPEYMNNDAGSVLRRMAIRAGFSVV